MFDGMFHCLNQDLQDYRIFKPRNQLYESLLGFPGIMCLKLLSGVGMINHSDVVRKRTIHITGVWGLVFSNLRPFKQGLIPPAV